MHATVAIPTVLFVLAAAGCSSTTTPSGTDPSQLPQGGILFSHSPVELTGVTGFVAMGEPNVLPKDHGGFPLLAPYTLPASVPVLAVASGVIIVAVRGTRFLPDFPTLPPADRGRAYDDWGLVFQVSSTMQARYAHISMLHPDLLAVLGGQPADDIGRNVEVPVSAGDTLGWIGPHAAMDFSVVDFDLNLDFLNPSRYPDTHIYSGDIFDYFQEPLRTQMLASAARQLPPRGGKIDYDVAGRIVGNWFLIGTTDFIQWSRQLAIVYDHLHGDRIFGDRIFISDGSPMNDVPGSAGPGAPDIYWINGNAPRPETVGVPEGMVQYTLISHGAGPDASKPVLGVMLVEMTAAGSIRVEIFKGVTQATAFTAAAKDYVR